jgi:hypothetical protein
MHRKHIAQFFLWLMALLLLACEDAQARRRDDFTILSIFLLEP